jgi:ferric-dicitrate binding protein FerR (iron transport regulator)
VAARRERSIAANEQYREDCELTRRNRFAKAYLDKQLRERQRRRARNRSIAWFLFAAALLVYSALGLSSTNIFATVI